MSERLGFLTAIYEAQARVPRLVEAERSLVDSLVERPGALSRACTESIFLAGLGVERNDDPCPPPEAALRAFGAKLAAAPVLVGKGDVERLRELGLRDEEILEGVQAAALGCFFATLSAGLRLAPGSAAHDGRPAADTPPSPEQRRGPYLSAVDRKPEDFEPFAFFRRRFGFVPGVFRAQTLRPDAITAQARVFENILLADDVLGRRQKEHLLIAVSAANRNTYWVAAQSQILRTQGVAAEESDLIATEHSASALCAADKTLLDAGLLLAARPGEFGQGAIDLLRSAGFSHPQILEAIVTVALTNFLNMLQVGLGVPPDFRPRRDYLEHPAGGMNPPGTSPRPTSDERTVDPDAAMVARAQGGDMAAFEALVRRHQSLVYRTVVGLTGNAEDAEDGTQSVFIKVFRKIGDFGGASKFSTWLTRIAINEGLERLRSRKPTESLDESEDDFRPSLVDAWVADPESLYARDEMRRLVQQELARLPALYRAAVLLRDIQQLSTIEAAAALDVPVPTLKTRLLRGRLMLREALAAHFAGSSMRARLA